MTIGIGAVVLMWSEGSMFREWIPSEPWRRLATGVLFAGGGTAVVLSRLGPGEWVGEMGLLLDLPRSASVVAVSDIEVDSLTPKNFEHLVAAHPEEGLRLMRQLAERLHRANQGHVV